MTIKKILIIRFSSFGDLLHGMPVVSQLKNENTDLHWLVRSDFCDLIHSHPKVDKVIPFMREKGMLGLIRLALKLRQQNYTHIYDAHNNLRSHIVCFIMASIAFNLFRLGRRPFLIRRSKQRFKRFLLFKLRINRFQHPYISTDSFILPIKKWIKSPSSSSTVERLNLPEPRVYFNKYICLAPSAAWELKKWPLEYYKALITQLISYNFVVLGGPDDDFCQSLEDLAPTRVKNLAGTLSWLESGAMIQRSELLISGDTGLMHFADFISTPNIALIGPSAFGFPKNPTSVALYERLSCQPCSKDGRGKCKNKLYKKCLVDILPDRVAKITKDILEK